MATSSRDIALNILGRTRDLQAEYAKIPGYTDRMAARAAKRWESQWIKTTRKQIDVQKKAAAQVSSAWRTIMTTALAAISVATVRRTAEMVARVTQEVHDYRNEISDTALQTALQAETLAALGLAAEASGGQLQELLAGLRQYPKRLDDFRRGTGEARVALEALGFESGDMDGHLQDVDTSLREVLRRLGAVEQDGRRAAMAVQLFGESGGRLAQVLNTSGIEDWSRAVQLGVDLSEEGRQRSAEWQVAVALLSAQWRGFKADVVDAAVSGSEGLIKLGSALIFVRTLLEKTAGPLHDLTSGITLLQVGVASMDASMIEDAAKRIASASVTFSRGLGEEAVGAAKAASIEFEAIARTLLGVASAERDTAVDLVRTTGELKRQTKAAAETEAALAALRQSMTKRRDLLRSLTDDLLTEEDRARRAHQVRLEQIAEINVATQGQLDLSRLLWESESRLQRDLARIEDARVTARTEAHREAHQLRLQQIEEERAASEATAEEQRRTTLRGLDVTASAIGTLSKAWETSARTRSKTDRKAAKKQAKVARSLATFAILADTAQAVIRAYALFGPPPSPAGIFAAANALAAGAFQAAEVRQAPLPTFYPGTSRSPGSTSAVLHEGEGVLNSRAVDMLGTGIIDALNAGMAPLSQMAGGGGGGVYLDGDLVGRTLDRRDRRRSTHDRGLAGYGSPYGRQ